MGRSTESNDKSPIITTYPCTGDNECGLQLIARYIKKNILFDAKNLTTKYETQTFQMCTDQSRSIHIKERTVQ